jgi:hypothetical protein
MSTTTINTIEFNASIEIKNVVATSIEKCATDLAIRCINACAVKYGFDANEALKMLCLENTTLTKTTKAKNLSSEPKEKKPRASKKDVFPMPFIASLVNPTLCNGLAYNKGLFTQCTKKQVDGSVYCKKCIKDLGEVSGIPSCGTIHQRLASGLYEFKDSKGRSPVSYIKLLEKQKLTIDNALDQADALGVEIDELHFTPIATKKASRGRPKKEKSEIKADNATDLFSVILNESADNAAPAAPAAPEKKPKKAKLTDEEKQKKKDDLKKERELKKQAEKDAKKKKDVKEATPVAPVVPVVETPKVEAPVVKPPKGFVLVTYNGIEYYQQKDDADMYLFDKISLDNRKKGEKLEVDPIAQWDPVTKQVVPVEVESDNEDNDSEVSSLSGEEDN